MFVFGDLFLDMKVNYDGSVRCTLIYVEHTHTHIYTLYFSWHAFEFQSSLTPHTQTPIRCFARTTQSFHFVCIFQIGNRIELLFCHRIFFSASRNAIGQCKRLHKKKTDQMNSKCTARLNRLVLAMQTKKNSATTNITVTLKAFEKWGKKENKQWKAKIWTILHLFVHLLLFFLVFCYLRSVRVSTSEEFLCFCFHNLYLGIIIINICINIWRVYF